MLLKISIFFLLLAKCVLCAKILGIIWTDSKSHHITMVPLLKTLAKKGHDVHLLSSFKDDVNIPTYKQELLTGILENSSKKVPSGFMDFLESRKILAENFWKNSAVENIVKTKPTFDLVICFAFFSDHTYALAHHLNAPLIVFSSGSAFVSTNKLVANPNLPYQKSLFSDRPIDTFIGRLYFATINLLLSGAEKYLFAQFQEDIKTKYLPEAPKIDEIHKNISLVFVNSHVSMEEPRPYVPNMIQIGGYNMEDVEKLPENLQKFLDSATDGAVLFSMGTNVKIGLQFADKIEFSMKIFRKLAPIKFLFKSEVPIPTAPENVLVVDWLPQNDVLAHPNVKLFITHGGLGGIKDAVYHGVPMLGIPFIGDQSSNLEFVIKGGLALKLQLNELNEETLEKSLVELLKNPKYVKNAKKRSSLFRNQPIKPMDHAIWWVEHIIEHKGGEHLKNIGVHLEWYQLYMVDIILFYLLLIVIVTTISFCTTKYVIKKIYNKFVRKTTDKVKVQ